MLRKFRYIDTAANLASLNPYLLQGESALESDTGKTKTGVSSISQTSYTSLSYDAGDGVPASATTASIATTGNTDAYIVAHHTGHVSAALFSPGTSLAASDTNYITFTITNLGQDGAGTNVMLAATNANTTKATGGTALTADTLRTLTVNGTATNLAVTKGDRLKVRYAVTGTLGGAIANAVTSLTISN